MKYLPQSPSLLAIYCFCLLQHPSSGYAQTLDDSPDGVDIVQLERLAYWATLSSQPKLGNLFHNIKDNGDIYKRFLFDYSRARETTQPVNTGFPPVPPSMRLAATLAKGKMKRFLQRDPGAVALDFIKKDHAASRGRPFFLFRVQPVSVFNPDSLTLNEQSGPHDELVNNYGDSNSLVTGQGMEETLNTQ